MPITMQGKTYELLPKGWRTCKIVRIEDMGMMSYGAGNPKPMIRVYFKPEGSQDDTTIPVLCTISRHPDATLNHICKAALDGYVPKNGEDLEALLIDRDLKVKNDHRVNSKDNLTYNHVNGKDPDAFAPPDPAAEAQDTQPSTKPPAKKARGNGGMTDPNKLKDTEIWTAPQK